MATPAKPDGPTGSPPPQPDTPTLQPDTPALQPDTPTLQPDTPTLKIPVRVQLADESDGEAPPGGACGWRGSGRGFPSPGSVSREGRRAAGRYLVEEEIGRGGMGVVYRAFDRDLRRRVAMKVMLRGMGVERELAERFIEEAQATAQLQHPGIVPVYEIGLDDDGKLFFTMKLVRGRTLADVVKAARAGEPEDARQGPPGPRGASEQAGERFTRFRLLQAFVEVARTVFYAHERGVIHRDLKPQNVMIGRYGEVQVMDWGLAKVLSQIEAARKDAPPPPAEAEPASAIRTGGERADTIEGAVVGTPAYMPPEQAEGDARLVGPLSDVYALGAMLYHVLTGRAPHEGKSTREVLAKVLTLDPPRPRELDPTVPRELEAICCRALAKKPEERYASAKALADDAQAWLEGASVSAYPEGPLGRAARWARRHRAVAATAIAALVLGFAGTLVALYVIEDRRQYAESARDEAQTSWALAERERDRANRELLRASAREVESNRNLAQVFFERADRAAEAKDVLAAEVLFAKSLTLAEKADDRATRVPLTRERLLAARIAGARLVFTTPEPVGGEHVALSPDGRRIAASCCDDRARVWDAASGRELFSVSATASPIAFSPDGKYVVIQDYESGYVLVRHHDVETGREVSRLGGAPSGAPRRAGNTALLVSDEPDDRASLAFRRDGRTLVVTGSDGVQVFDVESGRRTLCVGGSESELDPQGGAILVWGSGHGPALLDPEGRVLATVTGDERRVHLFDAASGATITSTRFETDDVHALALSPDGGRLATGDDDGVVRIFDFATGRLTLELRRHAGTVRAIAISPDGRRLASGGDDATVRVFDLSSGKELREIGGALARVTGLAFFPDGRRIVAGGSDMRVRVLDVETGREVRGSVRGPFETPVDIAFRPDGGAIALAADSLRVWDLASGRATLLVPTGRGDRPTCLAFSPDGTRLATGTIGAPGTVRDARTGKTLLELKEAELTDADADAGGVSVRCVSVSPDGSRIATGHLDAKVRVWDAASGRRLLALAHEGTVVEVGWSDDGQTIVSLDAAAVRRFDAASGEEHRAIRFPENGTPTAIALAPDGRRVATVYESHGSAISAVRILDTASGAEVLALRGHRYAPIGVAYSPDGLRIASLDGSEVRVWDASRGDLILSLPSPRARWPIDPNAPSPFGWGSSLIFDDPGPRIRTRIAFASDGRLLAISRGWKVEVWDLAPVRQALTQGWSWVPILSANGRWVCDLDDERGLMMIDLPARRVVRRWPDGTYVGAVSADGRLLATAGDDRRIHVEERAGGREVAGFPANDNPQSLVLSPDGRRLLALSKAKEGRLIRLFDVDAGREIAALRDREHALDLPFTPDGKRFATTDEGRIRLWDVETGAASRTITTEGDDGGACGVAFSPDGRRIAVREADRVVIRDLASGARARVLQGPQGNLTGLVSCAWTPDGRRIVSWGWEYPDRIIFWDVESGERVLEVSIDNEPVAWARFTPRGDELVTGGAPLRIWNLAALEEHRTSPADSLLEAAERGTALAVQGIDIRPAPPAPSTILAPPADE